MYEPDYSKAFHHTLNVATGLFVGGIGGARGISATGNAAWSAGVGLVGSGLATLLGGQRFFSKETVVDTLVFTASSAVMHLFTKSAHDHRHQYQPQISFAPDCGCKNKKWAERVNNTTPESALGRA